jgi:hypothetical protein
LHFYEYGRAAYGIARLIATIEHFRRTGSVASRITEKSYVSILIKAPEHGSFPIDVIIPLITEGSRIVAEYHIPVGTFLEYIIHTVKSLLPKHEKLIVELGKLEIQKEQQRTLQSVQETQRLHEVRKMVESGNIVTSTALKVVETALASTDTRLAQIGTSQNEMIEVRNQLRESKSRERQFSRYQSEFEGIDESDLARLVTRVRPQLAEVGLPLKRSATTARFFHRNEKGSFCNL